MCEGGILRGGTLQQIGVAGRLHALLLAAGLTFGVSGTVRGQEGTAAADGASESPSSSSEGSNEDGDSESEDEREFRWNSEEDLFDVEEPSDEARDDEESAEDESPRRSDRRLREMSKSEARRAGFEFDDESRASRGTSSVLLAATAGTVAHGIGHWYADDGRTAAFLAGTEGASAALLGAGLTTWFLEGETPVGSAIASKTFHLGAGLFGMSYLLDVVGSLRAGDAQDLEREGDLRGIDIEAAYRYLGARGYPLNHHIRGGVDFDFGRIFGRASTEQEFALDGSSYSGEVGIRWLRGQRPRTFAYAEGAVDFLDFRGTGGFDRWRGDLRLGVSVDLGFVAPHLERVALGAEAGYGRSWYTFDVSTSVHDAGLQSGFLPVEVYSRFDLGERVRTRVAYEQAPGRRLAATRRLGGMGRAEFVYESTETFDLEIGAEFGGGFSLTGGFLIHVW